MNQEEAYQKIKVGVFVDAEQYDTKEDIISFHPELMHKLKNKQKVFIDRFYNQIIQELENDNWGVRFIQATQYNTMLFVDIYVDSKESFDTILKIINKSKDDYEFSYYKRVFKDFK